MGRPGNAQTPHILTVPGLMNSGPGHWQSQWETLFPACHRVDLGSWDRPHRNSWVNRLDQTINALDGPILLAAHSLGCHAVAWWAALACPNWSDKIQGALLVAPPEVDARAADSRLHGFAPLPQRLLPFPSILVASHNDPYMPFERSRELAQAWGSQFADAGETGHAVRGGWSECRNALELAGQRLGRYHLLRVCDAISHIVQQPVVGRIISPPQSVFERKHIGRAMTLENKAPQPEQRSPVVATVIYAIFKGL